MLEALPRHLCGRWREQLHFAVRLRTSQPRLDAGRVPSNAIATICSTRFLLDETRCAQVAHLALGASIGTTSTGWDNDALYRLRQPPRAPSRLSP